MNLTEKVWGCKIDAGKPYSTVGYKKGDLIRITFISLAISPLGAKTSVYAKIGEDIYLLANLIAEGYTTVGNCEEWTEGYYEEILDTCISINFSDGVIFFTEGPGVVDIEGYQYFIGQDCDKFEEEIL